MQRTCPDCHAVYLYDEAEKAPAHCSRCGRAFDAAATAAPITTTKVPAAEVRSPTEKFFHSAPHPTDETGPTELGHAALLDDEPWMERPQKNSVPWTPIVVVGILLVLGGGGFLLLRPAPAPANMPDLSPAVTADLTPNKVDATVKVDLAGPVDLLVTDSATKVPPVEIVEPTPAKIAAPVRARPRPHHSKPPAAPARSLPRPPPTVD